MHFLVFWKACPLSEVPPQLTHVRSKNNEMVSLQGGSTLLLKASWLVDFEAKAEAPLPRRQDLPPGAGWDADELMTRVPEMTAWEEDDFGDLVPEQPVVGIGVSYCWETKVHPDPRREQLKLLARVATLRIQYRKQNPCTDLAVFFDFSSLFQRERTWLFVRSLSSLLVF